MRGPKLTGAIKLRGDERRCQSSSGLSAPTQLREKGLIRKNTVSENTCGGRLWVCEPFTTSVNTVFTKHFAPALLSDKQLNEPNSPKMVQAYTILGHNLHESVFFI